MSLEPWPSATSILRPLAQRTRAPEALGGEPAAAMVADRRVVDPEALEQPQRLREVARGDEHLVAAGPQDVDDGPHDEHVRRVGQVDPDAQGPPGYANSPPPAK